MSGHSKWATIKRKKGATDAARGRLFTRLIREIVMAARNGGDPDANPRLRLAIETARKSSMPMDNIKRAVARGTGDGESGTLDEVLYEGYGPAGIAVLIEGFTDNRNRTVAEIRNLLKSNGGAMAESGAVAWSFHRKGVIVVTRAGVDEDELMMSALDAGAEDLKVEEEQYEVICPMDKLETVRKALDEKKYPITAANLQYLPSTIVQVSVADAEAVMTFMEAIEENDDVQNVYSNFDLDEKAIASLG